MRSIKLELVNRNNSSLFGSTFAAVVVVVVFCNNPVVVSVVVIFNELTWLSSSFELSSDSTFAVMPSSSISNVRAATGFVFFTLFVVSVPLAFGAFVFRAGSSGNVIGVDDKFADGIAPFPLAIDVFREFALSNGDA